jgi:hypothetical protein
LPRSRPAEPQFGTARCRNAGGGSGFNGFIQEIYDAAGGGGTDADNHGLNLAALKQG